MHAAFERRALIAYRDALRHWPGAAVCRVFHPDLTAVPSATSPVRFIFVRKRPGGSRQLTNFRPEGQCRVTTWGRKF
jgi:hypothetical protein